MSSLLLSLPPTQTDQPVRAITYLCDIITHNHYLNIEDVEINIYEHVCNYLVSKHNGLFVYPHPHFFFLYKFVCI